VRVRRDFKAMGQGARIPQQVPLFVWDSRLQTERFTGAHIVGADNVDGSDTQVVTFSENLGAMTPTSSSISVV
jgi:hypothetical protein